MKNVLPIWHDASGNKVACTEKIKVMQQNIDELRDLAQDAFEDGILMGIAPNQLKDYLVQLMQGLINPYNQE